MALIPGTIEKDNDNHCDRRMALAAALWKNAKAESDANMTYAELLAEFGDIMEKKHVARIKEQMGDETTHNVNDIEMAMYYGQTSAAPDGLDEALVAIGESAESIQDGNEE